jgi:hypothetical protein
VLSSEAELSDERPVSAHVFPVEVAEQPSPAPHHLEEATTSSFVVLVGSKVVG